MGGEGLLSDDHFSAFEKIMGYVYEDCCKGGVDAQYDGLDQSYHRLEGLVCGVAESENGTAATQPLTGLERAQMEQLGKALEDVLRHLGLANEGLSEANLLGGGDSFSSERSTIQEMSKHLQQHLENIQKQTGGQATTDDDETAAKRRKTE